MKAAFATIQARYTMELEEILPRIASMGYDGAEIWAPHLIGRSDDEIMRVRSVADECGLEICQVTPYPCFTGCRSDYEWSMNHCRDMERVAGMLGAPNIRGLTSVGIKMTDWKQNPVVQLYNMAPSAAATEDQWKQAVRAYRELGAGEGPVWAIETHGNNLTDSAAGAKRLLAEVGSPRVKLTYQWFNDAGISEGLDAVWDHVAQVHLQHSSGEGEPRSRECLEQLAKRGYEGYVTVEFCDKPLWEVAPKELAIVREYT